MSLPATYNEIWHELKLRVTEEAIVSAVYQQLKSDIERSGSVIPFAPDLPPDSWKQALAAWLPSLSVGELHSYLYLIDLPENVVNMLEASSHFFEELADAIIYRELVKVYYRMNYPG
ncbi:MAG: hypothetical protein A3D31_13145 [Candidatus Fluviicola riflensis]|nr:MAG: hypothetical protein CHH17_17580 [Candidatus Fluviicola riflensis]OGS77927.1 MAG: hypothetical protein A3D31_13145 [Candidatus Fluviicola riflensis]OGS84992.1 MAG: hypothetical protein A2724_10080 [Fluviicola sp. RIFCSPHIGHO2_01_FULL_43_53]OGS89264.1 MAG: hypothetical protein A3E30_04385 [Fluviicola sp. RIFCSPHIGHO2_12_FULL_43_24]